MEFVPFGQDVLSPAAVSGLGAFAFESCPVLQVLYSHILEKNRFFNGQEGLTKKRIYIIITLEVNPWKIHWIE
jgi:hypothetical protein